MLPVKIIETLRKLLEMPEDASDEEVMARAETVFEALEMDIGQKNEEEGVTAKIHTLSATASLITPLERQVMNQLGLSEAQWLRL